VSLVCPSCGREHGDEERFCSACGLPLVVEGGPVEAVVSERYERARKVKVQYSEGAYVTVAVGRNQAESELIQNLLLEHGVPSALRRCRGFELPGQFASGPRDVLVPQSGETAARQVLLQVEGPASDRRPVASAPPWVVLVLGAVGAVLPFVALVLLVD
jgi:zinc-ribbon domain